MIHTCTFMDRKRILCHGVGGGYLLTCGVFGTLCIYYCWSLHHMDHHHILLHDSLFCELELLHVHMCWLLTFFLYDLLALSPYTATAHTCAIHTYMHNRWFTHWLHRRESLKRGSRAWATAAVSPLKVFPTPHHTLMPTHTGMHAHAHTSGLVLPWPWTPLYFICIIIPYYVDGFEGGGREGGRKGLR